MAEIFDDEEFERPVKKRTMLFIPKTEEEYGKGEKFSKALIEYCRPAKLGGIPVKAPVSETTEVIRHFEFMMKHIFANDFHTWCLSHSSGGGYDE